jgi:hypothetical protein
VIVRSLFVTVAALWSFAALAQSPIQLRPTLQAPQKHVVEDVQSMRFADDAETAGPALSRGDVVEVVLEDGDQVRVKLGMAFGWVPASALADAPPPEDALGAEPE